MVSARKVISKCTCEHRPREQSVVYVQYTATSAHDCTLPADRSTELH